MSRSRANAIDAATSFAFSAITIPCGRIESKRGSNSRRAFGYAADPGRINEPFSRASSDAHVGRGAGDVGGGLGLVCGVIEVAEDDGVERVQASRIGATAAAANTRRVRWRKARRSTRGA